MKKDLLAVLPTGYGYNPSRFARANSAFQKFAYSWQNSGLHEAPANPRTRFCSGGKRQKTGSNKKNIGERSDLSCCPPRVPIGLLRSPMLFFHPRHFQIPVQSANRVLKIEVWSFLLQTTNCGLRLTVSRYPSAHIWDLRFASGSLRLPRLFSFIHLLLF